jgi:hypothetical protein
LFPIPHSYLLILELDGDPRMETGVFPFWLFPEE